jgi:hypothetical protein
MVSYVRINELIASIAISSGGSGRTRLEAVVLDLRNAIGATETAVMRTVQQAARLNLITQTSDHVFLVGTFKALGTNG